MIVVFGSVNLDLVARVDRLPHEGETIAGTSFAALPGGKGANQALAARRAGASVSMSGAVGADGFAGTALRELVAAGIDLQAVRRLDTPTGIALIHVDAAGRNAITVIAGANAHAAPEDVAEGALGPETTLVLQLEVPLEAVAAIAIRARHRGARVILNAAPARPLSGDLIGALDVLIVNEHEAASIAASQAMPAAPADFAAAFHRRNGCAVVVTLGAAGAIAAVDGAMFRVEAPKVRVIDTVGAGDALVGALAAALDRGADWTRAIAEGVAAGALACTVEGAQAALPGRAAIDALAATVAAGVRRPSLA
jgi:ribokinase